ncbi:hypothetical protein KI688_004998 [Linnemannia hyalina]|uniref:Uncharacterized protein n=1 Tax=Linnemannia hyalina TaxID=64524 RepID=A0A9P7XLC7_9FUNG|nr:hypothetical protein KI688_004998 [Linnemannia hyalina]
MKSSKGSWSPKKIYQAFRNNGTAYQQQQQQQVRLRSDPSAPVNEDVTQPMAKTNISCIHLGFAAYMITSVMLAYNGIMSVLLLQASRVPDDTNHEIWLKNFLVRDAKTGTWIISVAEWILAFLGIFLVQVASWYWVLLAYDRQMRDRRLKEKNTNAGGGGGAPRSLPTVSEKV